MKDCNNLLRMKPIIIHFAVIIFSLCAVVQADELIKKDAAISGKNEIAIYLSPAGNDRWSGKTEAPAKDGLNGPFKTLTRARDEIRNIKKENKLNAPVNVYLQKGTFFLEEPVIFTPEDSGTKEFPVTYRAYKNEKPVISGGKIITGWKNSEGSIWTAELKGVKEGKWNFKQLFVNGERRYRARLPKAHFYKIAKLLNVDAKDPYNTPANSFGFAGEDIKAGWTNLNDVEVVVLNFWVDIHLPIAGVDDSTKTVTFTRKSRRKLNDDVRPSGARYYVDNVFEGMDSPGEWYLDRKKGIIYYIKKQEEEMQSAEIIAPSLENLVRFEGDFKNGKFVEYVVLKGLTLSHNEYNLPANEAGDYQAATGIPGCIYAEGARNCSIENCSITNIGTYGIEISSGCRNNIIDRNEITDAGAGGIKISGGKVEAEYTGNIVFTNNQVFNLGKIFPSAVGILSMNSDSNTFSHNHIHHFYYTGISVGWVWGYGPSVSRNNVIEYNHIHDIGQGILSDMGGIYTLGISDGTVISNNLIHDVYAWSYGGWGIYMDEGSSNILIENNIVYNTKSAGFNQHYGRGNIVRNNIFAFGKEFQLTRTRMEPHISFTFENNIVLWDAGELLGGSWGDGKYKMDNNLYYNTSKKDVYFLNNKLADWRTGGHDAGSIIADPLFADPGKFDFTLRPESPAFKLGFKAIDTGKVGPLP